MDYTIEQLEDMKTPELLNIAILKSSNEYRFKKTIHGKNKDTLIEFIKNCSDKPITNNNLFISLQKLSKEDLINYCQGYIDYKKSYERKCKEFQVEFLVSKNFDISDNKVSPEIEKMKKLMSLKKTDLLNYLKKKEIFKSSFERKDKEELAKMLINDDIKLILENSSTSDSCLFSKKSLRELKDLAMKNPLYNTKTFGKSKSNLIDFLKNHSHIKHKEENDDEECVSPINIHEFMIKPDPEQIREALTKILTSKENIF